MLLDPLFSPASVAVVGASRDPRQVGRRILDALVSAPFEGPVFAVNPSTGHVGAVPAHDSLRDIGSPVDLVVVAVPAALVVDIAREAGQIGASALIVVSADFAESGEEGARRQDELSAVVAEHGMRMVGPNCLGLVNTDPAVRMNASFAPSLPPHGELGLCSQSGALGIAIINLAEELGLGLSSFVSVGNQADVTVSDVVERWGDDERTEAGLLYVESFTDPDRFRSVATEVTTHTPLVAVKAGTTAAGSRAASSHTAALAGSDRAVEALLAQSNVIRAESLQDMFGIARIVVSQPLDAGRRAVVVTNSGGPGVLCVDALRRADHCVDQLSDATRKRLQDCLPSGASTANPVDMLATADADTYGRVVETVLDSGEVDVLIVIYTPIGLANDAEVSAEVESAVAAARDKGAAATVLMSVVGSSTVGGAVPTFEFPEDLARLLGPIGQYCDRRARGRGAPVDAAGLHGCDLAAARQIVRDAVAARGEGWLTVAEARAVLDAVGVRLSRGAVVSSADEAVRVAADIDGPVAVSIASTEVVHKTDVGGVHLDLQDEAEVRAAVTEIFDVARQHDVGLDGVLVAAMEGGVELFVGVERDPAYGPLVGVGSGGTQVEVLDDVAFRLAPLTDHDVDDQLRSIRGWKLLQGHRGAEPADIDAVKDVVARISVLVDGVEEIRELDVNPLFAQPGGAVSADVRILVTESPTDDRRPTTPTGSR